MRRALALVGGLLLTLHTLPATACRSADFFRYLISKSAPADPPPDVVVLEVSDLELPQDRLQYTTFRARVVRVIQGKYGGSTITIATQAFGNCTFLSEVHPPISGYVVGTLVRGNDGSLVLDAQGQKRQSARQGL